ncbi:uncharacterized protein KIAA2012 [Cheilinus undulatus]|uniref:uncharacterized protein KIAA2012 n=1 Tax=Cheilinus undulatus TaxID=241271 RepID=UPI001BD69983|nr:uncharacterized protein KIAA2012 [Cheilinus undulatus]
MNDLPLSLLSRGCGRFVASNTNTGRNHGRLEVCFTPQDYFVWKSQDSLLRLSKSGHLLVKAESTLPKTYSTRRGPLLLYSQDFVTVETSLQPESRDRKQQEIWPYTEEVEQLSTLKELTAAILNYNENQFNFSRLGPLLFPPLHVPISPDLRPPVPSPICTTSQQPYVDLLSCSNSQWGYNNVPAERNTAHLESHPEDKEEQDRKKNIRLDVFLQIPCTDRTPTPQMEPQPWIHYVAITPHEPEELQQKELDKSLQSTESLQHSEPDLSSIGDEIHHLNREHDVTEGEGHFIQDCQTVGVRGDNEGVINRNKHRRTGLLPPLTQGQLVSPVSWEKEDKLRRMSPSSDDHRTQLLPPIAESCAGTPSWPPKVKTPLDVQPKGEKVWCQAQENQNKLHQQPLSLPQLFPEELSGKKKAGGGKRSQRHNLKKERAWQAKGEGGERLVPMVLLEPGEDPPPAGVLGYVAGRRGPGKQSSLAFLQNQLSDLQDPHETCDDDRGVVRGVLPLELRDLQNGKPVGCLIVGPDGEILQLSLYENSQDTNSGDGDTQEKALQVLSPEGERLPWVVMLQPEYKHAGGEEENKNVLVHDVQLHQSIKKLLDLHRSADAFSPRSLTDPGEPLKNFLFKDDASCSQQNIYVNETTSDDTVDTRRKNTEGKDAKVAAKIPRDVKTGKPAESDGHKTSRRRKEGRSLKEKTGRDVQPVRSQKQEERVHKDAAETQDQSVLHPDLSRKVKNKMADMRGERGSLTKSKEREERGDAGRRRRESADKKRRGELKHKELVYGSPEEKEEELNQGKKEKSHPASTKSPSATQKHDNKPNSKVDPEDTDMFGDKLSSIQSVSSLRSAAAVSQSNLTSSRRSLASTCEEAGPASAMGLTSSHGRLSSCSTVMVTEEQLMLNPVKPEVSKPRKSQREEEEEAAALRLAQRAERRRQEVERKRKEREEEERRQQEREQTEDRMKNELEEERRRRAEEIRLKKMAEEEKKRKQEEEELERARREQEQREREKRRQEERRWQMERLQKMREEMEQKRRVELERLRLEEERRQEEENKKLQEMDENEREEYLHRKKEEEEVRRKNEDERRRREEEEALQAAEEARLQAELLARQMALLQQQLALKRRLLLDAVGLEKTQAISRPWVFSYFTLLQIMGLNPT